MVHEEDLSIVEDFILEVNRIVDLNKIEDTDRIYEFHGGVMGRVLGIVYNKQRQILTVWADKVTDPSSNNTILNIHFNELEGSDLEKGKQIYNMMREARKLIEMWNEILVGLHHLEQRNSNKW